MLVAVGYAIGPIIINRRLADLPPMGVITASLIVATVLYAPFAVWLWPERITRAGRLVDRRSRGDLHRGRVPGVLRADRRGGPARATVITYINPAVAITLGVLLLNEPFTIGMAIGFPLVIIGSVLATARVRGSRAAGDRPMPTRTPRHHRRIGGGAAAVRRR